MDSVYHTYIDCMMALMYQGTVTNDVAFSGASLNWECEQQSDLSVIQ